MLFVPPIYRCYVWNMARIGFMASEEMLFENVDDGWTMDGRRMPAYTLSSPMSLRLRWAKNSPPVPHLLQAQQALALPYAKVVGRPSTRSYPAPLPDPTTHSSLGGARWLSGRVSDSGARGWGFDTYRRRDVSLSKTLYSPKVLVNYPGSGGSVPTWLKNCWLGH